MIRPTCAARALIWSGVTTKPQCRITSAALAAVVPMIAAGALIAKYMPGVSTHAAISAMTATSDSVSMAP